MSVLIRYQASGVTREHYDKVNEFFTQQMQTNPDLTGPPDTLKVHVLFGDEGDLQVSEVWESEEAWREMYDGGLLGQALDHAGIQRDPVVIPVQELWGNGVPGPPAPPA
jgi:hypothetical protein